MIAMVGQIEVVTKAIDLQPGFPIDYLSIEDIEKVRKNPGLINSISERGKDDDILIYEKAKKKYLSESSLF